MYGKLDIIKKAISTEKAYNLKEKNRSLTFVVSKTATKTDVSDAIQELYGIKPEKVNIMNVKSLRLVKGGKSRKAQNKLLTFKKVYVKFPVGYNLKEV